MNGKTFLAIVPPLDKSTAFANVENIHCFSPCSILLYLCVDLLHNIHRVIHGMP